MVILGIADGPDASAAIVVDGKPVAAVAQEAIDRVRHSRAFPSGAIDAALDVAGVKPREVDRIAVGTSFTLVMVSETVAGAELVTPSLAR